MLRARRAPWVKYHNIIGVVQKSNWFGGEAELSDGVVGVASAHMDDVASEILVDSKHQDIHCKPRAILEVRSILVDHLREVCKQPEIANILEVPNHWYNSSRMASGQEPADANQTITASYFQVADQNRISPIIVSNDRMQGEQPSVVPASALAPLPYPTPRRTSRMRLSPLYNANK